MLRFITKISNVQIYIKSYIIQQSYARAILSFNFDNLCTNALHISDLAHKPQKTFANVTVLLIYYYYPATSV
jgi:hypothetical protein